MDLTASREQTLKAIMLTSNIFFHSDTVPSIQDKQNIYCIFSKTNSFLTTNNIFCFKANQIKELTKLRRIIN